MSNELVMVSTRRFNRRTSSGEEVIRVGQVFACEHEHEYRDRLRLRQAVPATADEAAAGQLGASVGSGGNDLADVAGSDNGQEVTSLSSRQGRAPASPTTSNDFANGVLPEEPAVPPKPKAKTKAKGRK